MAQNRWTSVSLTNSIRTTDTIEQKFSSSRQGRLLMGAFCGRRWCGKNGPASDDDDDDACWPLFLFGVDKADIACCWSLELAPAGSNCCVVVSSLAKEFVVAVVAVA